MHEIRTPKLLNGYILVYKPEHPSCMKNNSYNGWIYEHIYVMEKSLKRNLAENEIVHHLDENRENNRLENLIVLSPEHHARLHTWTRGITKIKKIIRCKICFDILQNTQTIYCSAKCVRLGKPSKRISEEQLLAELKDLNWVKMGKKYNVNDNTIRKWAKFYGYNPKTLRKELKIGIQRVER